MKKKYHANTKKRQIGESNRNENEKRNIMRRKKQEKTYDLLIHSNEQHRPMKKIRDTNSKKKNHTIFCV